MKPESGTREHVEQLLRRQKALAKFGTFSFREPRLDQVLAEAARICAECLDVPFSKMGLGETAHVVKAGSPAQVNATLWLNPPEGATEIV